MGVEVAGNILRRNQPSAAVDEQLVLEEQEMRVARITVRHTETVDFGPALRVVASEDNDLRSGEDHVPVRTDAEREIEPIAKPTDVGEGVVETIATDGVDRVDVDGWTSH